MRALTLIAFLSGCAFSTKVTPAVGAASRPPSSYAKVVHEPPSSGTEIGTIDAQGNNWQTASDCEAHLVLEARKLGANVVFTQPEEANHMGQGPRCVGRAYYVETASAR